MSASLRFRAFFAAAFLALIAVPLAAQEPPEEGGAEPSWTPELQMRYRAVQGTAISPDGSRVAFVVREPVMDGEKSEYLSHIWLASSDGTRAFQFTRGEKSATSPRFSPDGRYLAFTSSRSGGNQVWVMPVGGGEAWQVTDTKDGVGAYRWSPDGTRIAFSMVDPDTEEEDRAKKEKYYVIRVDQDFKNQHLYMVDVGDGTTEPAEATGLTAGEFSVTGFGWSPDGSRIAFTHRVDPRINTARLSGDLAVVTVDDGEITQLVTGAGIEGQPDWSPDGRWIAYRSSGERPEPIGLGDVYLVSPSGSDSRALAHTPDRSANILG